MTLLRDWVTFLADICILLITVYTFYLTFISKRIKLVSVTFHSSIHHADVFSVVIKNKTLSPIIFNNIYLIIDNKYKFNMKEFESPQIIGAFSVQKITSDLCSYTLPHLPHNIMARNVAVEVRTAEKKIYACSKKTYKITKEIKALPYNVSKITQMYNDMIVPLGARFVIMVFNSNSAKTIFVFASGCMTDEILGINGLPEEAIVSTENFTAFLSDWLNPMDIKYAFEELEAPLDEAESD